MPGARPHARGRLRQPRGADGADDGAPGAGADRASGPTCVVVPGDVNSTLAAALTAVEAGHPGRPRRVRAAQLRHDDARGGQPDRRRPLLRPALPPQRGGGRQPARRRDPRRAHALRRQHDDRHPGRARRPFPRRRRPRRASASSPAPTCWSPCTGRPWSTGRCSARRSPSWRPGARDAGRLPGPPAHPQDDGGRSPPSTPACS